MHSNCSVKRKHGMEMRKVNGEHEGNAWSKRNERNHNNRGALCVGVVNMVGTLPLARQYCHGLKVGYVQVRVWVHIPVPATYKTSPRTSKMDEN